MFSVAAGISAEQLTRHGARGCPTARPEERDLRRRKPSPQVGSGGPAPASQGHAARLESDRLRPFFAQPQFPSCHCLPAQARDGLSPNISPQSAQRPQRPTVFQKIRETRLSRTFQIPSRIFSLECWKYRGFLCVLCVLCGSNAMSGFKRCTAMVSIVGFRPTLKGWQLGCGRARPHS